jgi:hypothetical protein
MASIINGSNNVSDVFNAFSGLPGPLGLAASGFGLLNKLQEESFASYQKMTQAGINFGGAINDVRTTASNMGMSFDQLSGFLVKNSEDLARMGGGTDKAAQAFSVMSKAMIGSEIGDHLRALGMTTEQVNQGMLNYIKFTGGRTSKEMANTDQLIKSAASYMEELDGLARITGKTKEQQEEALAEAAKNAAYQAKLATMTLEERQKATEGLARALALGGKGAADVFQSKIMGISPDAAGQMYIAIAGKQAKVVDQIANTVMDKNKTVEDQKSLMVAGMRAAQQDIAKFGSSTAFAISRTGGPVGDALNALGINANKAATMTDAQILAAMEKAAVDKSAAADAVQNEKKMMQMRDSLLNMLDSLRKQYGPAMEYALTQFVRGITYLSTWVDTFRDVIGDAVLKIGVIGLALSGIISTIKFAQALAGPTRAATTVAGTVASGAGATAGAGTAGFIRNIGLALALLGPEAPLIVAGAAAIGGAIIAIGAGIAGATWLIGASLPKFAEGLKSFSGINGADLLAVGTGIAGLGAAMAFFSGTNVASQAGSGMSSFLGGVTKFFGGKDTLGQITNSVAALKPSLPILTALGPALNQYASGLVSFGKAVDSINLAKAAQISTMFAKPIAAAPIMANGTTLTTAANVMTSTGTPAMENKSSDIQMLNTTMREVLKYVRDTAEYTKRTVDATRALNGNFFPTP